MIDINKPIQSKHFVIGYSSALSDIRTEKLQTVLLDIFEDIEWSGNEEIRRIMKYKYLHRTSVLSVKIRSYIPGFRHFHDLVGNYITNLR